jgi:hypothetical protein
VVRASICILVVKELRRHHGNLSFNTLFRFGIEEMEFAGIDGRCHGQTGRGIFWISLAQFFRCSIQPFRSPGRGSGYGGEGRDFRDETSSADRLLGVGVGRESKMGAEIHAGGTAQMNRRCYKPRYCTLPFSWTSKHNSPNEISGMGMKLPNIQMSHNFRLNIQFDKGL